MPDLPRRIVFEGFIPTGDGPAPASYVDLNLTDLSDQQVIRFREQAQQVVDRFADSERAIILNAFRSCVEAASRLLEHASHAFGYLKRPGRSGSHPIRPTLGVRFATIGDGSSPMR